MNHLLNLAKMHGCKPDLAHTFALAWSAQSLDFIESEIAKQEMPLWALSSLSCYLNLLSCDAGALSYD